MKLKLNGSLLKKNNNSKDNIYHHLIDKDILIKDRNESINRHECVTLSELITLKRSSPPTTRTRSRRVAR